MDTTLYEASSSLSPLVESGETRKGIWRMKLIAGDVQGSSGYYPAEVLERDGPLVFPAGTHVFFDHPSSEENWSRPERTVRDLAGAFVTAAAYESDAPEGAGLYANVQLFPEADTWMEPRKNSVGMSIRANGTVADTDTGYTITSLTEGLSVDIVTRAGAGGKVLQLMEHKKSPAAAAGASDEATAATLKTLAEGQTKTNEVLASLVTALTESTKAKAEEPAKGLTAVELVTKLNESGLPDAARTRVAQVYKDGDDLDALVAAEQKYIDALTESAKTKKVTRSAGDTEDTTTGVVESGKTNTDNKSTADFSEAAALLDLEV